jgi:hypothetical protein
MITHANRLGRWRLLIPRSSTVRLFGVSMTDGGRTIQAEGYLAIPPTGPGAQLRAGSGALVFARSTSGLRLLAVDFDGKGGAVVSGLARPGAGLTLSVDGAPRDTFRADPQGRFSVALDEPPFAGGHELGVSTEGSQARVSVPATSIPPRVTPFVASSNGSGWRIDWMTPGGGPQTTLVLGDTGAAE